ncbi:hypothetical protein HDV00_006238 [Rhizophlyctis rosea]|nr:hypothetical protein HDV00_006238 [Rhizophlyctis rosea]
MADSTTPLLQQEDPLLEDVEAQLSTDLANEEKAWRKDHASRPEGHWRKKLGHVLEHTRFHWLVLFLVLLDLVVVLTEIISTFLENNCTDTSPSPAEHPLWHDVLAHISTVILILFNLELIAHLVAFGPRFFTHNALHLFDAAVVITSLILDLVLRGKEQEVAGLLVVLRCWRLVRVVDGVVLTVTDQYKGKIDRLEKENAQLKEEVQRLKSA